MPFGITNSTGASGTAAADGAVTLNFTTTLGRELVAVMVIRDQIAIATPPAGFTTRVERQFGSGNTEGDHSVYVGTKTATGLETTITCAGDGGGRWNLTVFELPDGFSFDQIVEGDHYGSANPPAAWYGGALTPSSTGDGVWAMQTAFSTSGISGGETSVDSPFGTALVFSPANFRPSIVIAEYEVAGVPVELTPEFTSSAAPEKVAAWTLSFAVASSGETGTFTGAAQSAGTVTGQRARAGLVQDAATAGGAFTGVGEATAQFDGDAQAGSTYSGRAGRKAAAPGGAVASGEFSALGAGASQFSGAAVASGTFAGISARAGQFSGGALAGDTSTGKRARSGILSADASAAEAWTGEKQGQKIGNTTAGAIATGSFARLAHVSASVVAAGLSDGAFVGTTMGAEQFAAGAVADGTATTVRHRKGTAEAVAAAGDSWTAIAPDTPAREATFAAEAGDGWTATAHRAGTLAGHSTADGRFSALGAALALFGEPRVRPALTGAPQVNEVDTP